MSKRPAAHALKIGHIQILANIKISMAHVQSWAVSENL